TAQQLVDLVVVGGCRRRAGSRRRRLGRGVLCLWSGRPGFTRPAWLLRFGPCCRVDGFLGRNVVELFGGLHAAHQIRERVAPGEPARAHGEHPVGIATPRPLLTHQGGLGRLANREPPCYWSLLATPPERAHGRR